MKNVLEILKNIGMWALTIGGILIILTYIGIEIYIWIVYGGTSIDEIPMWALRLMWWN